MRALVKGTSSKIIGILGKDGSSLDKLSKRLGLSLSIEEMKLLQEYFAGEKRDPTDVELNAMAQAWSEHCCYKSSKFYLKKYFRDLKRDYVYLAMEDDAAVVRLDDQFSYVLKMESHNHPSAIEPYGGAATGVGGIIRDILCMGAQPVALVDSLFFGDPAFAGDRTSMSTRSLFSGIVAGIRDYGNRVGIPTVSGSIYFHPSYNHNPLVNAGCLGIIRTSNVIRSRISKTGYLLIIAGGRTGRDGIHGVNFASRSIAHGRDDSRSVQLGNPIVEEPLIHAILEASDRGLIEGMKDLGGGGMSSAIGELVHAGGIGAKIYLEKVLLKEEGMLPWEIWVSESQERMLLAVHPDRLEDISGIFRLWDTEFSVVGETVEGDRLVITYNGEKVLDLDLEFMTSGLEYQREADETRSPRKTLLPKEPADFGPLLINMISNPNIGSREPVVRQYDHTVRGSTLKGPLSGNPNIEGPSDSSLILAQVPSGIGLALTSGSRPILVSADPANGSKYCVTEAAMNILSSGAVPHSVVDCLNFGSPTDSHVMNELIESIRGISEVCRDLSLPVVSGNVSLYNSYRESHIIPTPVIMMVGLLDRPEKAVKQYLSREGDAIFVAGNLVSSLNGSLYEHSLGTEAGNIDPPDMDEMRAFLSRIPGLVQKGVIEAMHDVSDGGLATALAEMCLGSGIGMKVDIGGTGYGTPSQKMFSELGNRMVIAADPSNEEIIRKGLGELRLTRIGTSGGRELEILHNGVALVKISVDSVRKAYGGALHALL